MQMHMHKYRCKIKIDRSEPIFHFQEIYNIPFMPSIIVYANIIFYLEYNIWKEIAISIITFMIL